MKIRGRRQVVYISEIAGDLPDIGSANAYKANVSPYITALTDGIIVKFRVANTNTTASTFEAYTLGTDPIEKYDGSGWVDLEADDLPAGAIAEIKYDGSRWQLMSVTRSNAAVIAHNHYIGNDAGVSQFGFAINDMVRIAGTGILGVSFNAGIKQVTLDVPAPNYTHSHYIANSVGTNQFSYGIGEAVRVEGVGGTVVSFNAGSKSIIITSPSAYTVDNGLIAYPTSNNFQLGGSLLHDTTINADNYYLSIDTVASGVHPFRTNSTTGHAIISTATTGHGIVATSTSGNGIAAISGTGLAGTFTNQPASTNSNEPVIQIHRNSSGSAANGIAGSIDYWVKTSSGGAELSHSLRSKYTDVTSVSRTSQFEIWGVNSATLARKLAIAGSGQITADAYGAGTFSEAATYLLGVTGAGKIVELVVSGGGAPGSVTSVDTDINGTALLINGINNPAPITLSGTYSFGWQGNSSQYVTGAGTLATFPTIDYTHLHFIANSAATNQFSFGINDAVQFDGTGATTVSFNSGSKRVIINSTDLNNYPTSLTYISEILTIGRNGLSALTVNIPITHNHYVADSLGVNKFGYGREEAVRYAAGGSATVSFNAGSKTITYSVTETDPVAVAKTVTLIAGTGITIPETATQTVGSNPSWTINANTSYFDGRFILNQYASAQTVANFWISNKGRADEYFQSPTLHGTGNLTLSTTPSVSKGNINFGTSYYNESANTLVINSGGIVSGERLEVFNGNIVISNSVSINTVIGMLRFSYQTLPAAYAAVVGTTGNDGVDTTRLKFFTSYGSPAEAGTINEYGNWTLNSLAGAGYRMVVADSIGTLSTQAIPGGGGGGGFENLFTHNLTQGDNRTHSGNSKTFVINSTAGFSINGLTGAAFQVQDALSKLVYNAYGFQVRSTGSVEILGLTNDNTKTQVLVKDVVTNQLFYRDASSFGGATYTVNNGLSASPTSSNFQLGGDLVHDTYINNFGYLLNVNGTRSFDWVFEVRNHHASSGGCAIYARGGSAILANATASNGFGVKATAYAGRGVDAYAVSGTAVYAQSASGTGVYSLTDTGVAGDFIINPASNNSYAEVAKFQRTTSAGSSTDGIGGYLSFHLHCVSFNTLYEASRFGSRWINNNARTSAFDWYLKNSDALARKMSLAGNGKLTLDTYGAGIHTGAESKRLAVDVSGNVIEVDNSITGTLPTNEAFRTSNLLLTANVYSDATFTTAPVDGRYFVTATVTVASPNNSAQAATLSLTNGADTVHTSTTQTGNAVGLPVPGYLTLTTSCFMNLLSGAAAKARVKSSTTSTVVYTAAGEVNVTTIRIIKVGDYEGPPPP